MCDHRLRGKDWLDWKSSDGRLRPLAEHRFCPDCGKIFEIYPQNYGYRGSLRRDRKREQRALKSAAGL